MVKALRQTWLGAGEAPPAWDFSRQAGASNPWCHEGWGERLLAFTFALPDASVIDV